MFKNRAGQFAILYAWNQDTDAPYTGGAATITAVISKDGGAEVATATANPTEIGGGLYKMPLSQAETNADNLVVRADDSSAVTVSITPVIYGTMPAPVRAARLRFQLDNVNARDEYTCCWFEDGVSVTPTGVTIQVIKRADGADLIAATAMTRVALTAFWKYDASGAERISSADAVMVVLVATFADGTATYTEIR